MKEVIAVIGAGPAGIAAAISCARLGMAVTLFERGDMQGYRAGEHLSAYGRTRLRRLGIDERELLPYVRDCVCVESCWGDEQRRSDDAIFNPHGPGWLLERPAFDQSLARFARRFGVELRADTRVLDITRRVQGWTLTCDEIGSFDCAAVIYAGGRTSRLVERLGPRRIIYDQLVGISAVRSLAHPSEGVLIESTRDGWWYSAALPNSRLICSYMTDADLVHAAGSPGEAWRAALAESEHTRARWGEATLPDETLVRSARSQVLECVLGSGYLIVGDGALARDPLSSQGIAAALDAGFEAGEQMHKMLQGELPRCDYPDRVCSYLRARAHVYGLERRFADRPFWQRRHRELWATAKLSLDPNTRIQRPDRAGLERVAKLCPGVDLEQFVETIGDGGPAYDIARKLQAFGTLHDLEWLVALERSQRL